jgi:predicted acyltransferase
MVKISDRLVSLDVFRGITMAAMVLVENPGNWSIYLPFRHARWGMQGDQGIPVHETITPTDLIMPWFLFIIGISLVFSLGKYKEPGSSQREVVRKISTRATKLYLLGVFLCAYPSLLEALLYGGAVKIDPMGVLQRIAIVYFASAIVFLKCSRKTIVWASAVTLVVYWLILSFVPEPDNGATLLFRQHFTEGNIPTNIVAWVDDRILGFEHPVGILSTFPAIVTGLIGVLVGLKLKVEEDVYKKTLDIVFAGIAMLAAGYLWGFWFPVIKDMWTSSYTLVAGGYGLVAFAFVYWLVDINGSRGWTPPFVAYGVNCISVYVVSHLVYGTLWTVRVNGGTESLSVQEWIDATVFQSWLSPFDASLAYALCVVAFWLIPLWYMYKRQIYIKI